jgi:hypothetical protein
MKNRLGAVNERLIDYLRMRAHATPGMFVILESQYPAALKQVTIPMMPKITAR